MQSLMKKYRRHEAEGFAAAAAAAADHHHHWRNGCFDCHLFCYRLGVQGLVCFQIASKTSDILATTRCLSNSTAISFSEARLSLHSSKSCG